MSNKIYNVGAHGIPASAVFAVRRWNIDRLRWSPHAVKEASKLIKHGLIAPNSIPTTFCGLDEEWQLVEAETNALQHPVKIVVRRKVNATWTLVFVIDNDAIVRTCWANLNTDNHRTLDKTRFDKP